MFPDVDEREAGIRGRLDAETALRARVRGSSLPTYHARNGGVGPWSSVRPKDGPQCSPGGCDLPSAHGRDEPAVCPWLVPELALEFALDRLAYGTQPLFRTLGVGTSNPLESSATVSAAMGAVAPLVTVSHPASSSPLPSEAVEAPAAVDGDDGAGYSGAARFAEVDHDGRDLVSAHQPASRSVTDGSIDEIRVELGDVVRRLGNLSGRSPPRRQSRHRRLSRHSRRPPARRHRESA